MVREIVTYLLSAVMLFSNKIFTKNNRKLSGMHNDIQDQGKCRMSPVWGTWKKMLNEERVACCKCCA